MEETSSFFSSKHRVSSAFLSIAWFFLERPQEKLCGSDVMKELKLPSGTVYPILARMNKHGWLTRELEEVDPKVVNRPQRHYYIVTQAGLTEGRRLITTKLPGIPMNLEPCK